MAWLGTATSLGFVVGPALGGLLSRRNLHFSARFWHCKIDSFSNPFFAAAALGLLTFFVAMRWLPESLSAPAVLFPKKETERDWRRLAYSLRPLLGLVLIGQFGLAAFEATFALYAQAMLNYGPARVGAAFMVCGLVMAVFQFGAVGFLAGRISEICQIGAGFELMGASLLLLVTAHTPFLVFVLVGLVALGTALISPNLAALIPKRSGSHRVGESLGVQNAATSLAQVSRPILGGVLFAWRVNAPYLLTGALLVAVGLIIGWRMRAGRRPSLQA